MYSFKEVEAAALAQWLASEEDIRVIDVRSPAETARGVVPGSELMPLHLLPLNAEALARCERIVFYCQSGARSAQACMFLAQQGCGAELYNLRGGIMGWVQAGQGVVAPAGEASAIG